MNNIVRLANKFILLQNIDRLPLNMEQLRTLCINEKLALLSYGEAKELIASLSLQAHTERNAFLLQAEGTGLILYKDTLPLGEKLFAIAHELGHHVLGHTFYGICEQNFKKSAQEREADAFALHILAPLCVLREQHLYTVGKIQAETLLDRERAIQVLRKLRRYRCADRLDAEVLARFGLTRNPHEAVLEKRTKLLIIHLFASLLILVSGLQFIAYRIPYADTDIDTYMTDTSDAAKPERAIIVYCRRGLYHQPFCPMHRPCDLAMTEEEALCTGYVPCNYCRTDKRYKGD